MQTWLTQKKRENKNSSAVRLNVVMVYSIVLSPTIASRVTMKVIFVGLVLYR